MTGTLFYDPGKRRVSRRWNKRVHKFNRKCAKRYIYLSCKFSDLQDRFEVTSKHVDCLIDSWPGDCCDMILLDDAVMLKEPAAKGGDQPSCRIPIG